MIKLDEFQIKLYNETFVDNTVYLLKAVAGAGKSHTIVSKVIKLVREEGYNPERILMTSFTNLASRELQHRVSQHLSVLPFISTLHGLGRELLKSTIYESYSIATEWHCILLMRDQVANIERFKDLSKSELTSITKPIYEIYSKLRNKSLINIDSFLSDLKQISTNPDKITINEIITVIYNYFTEKNRLKILDYDDMIWVPLQLAKKSEKLREIANDMFDVLFIDEAQDLSQSQYDLIHLCAKNKKLILVGDLCQSIYGFRDAIPANFSSEYFTSLGYLTKEFELRNNYRSEPSIVNISNKCRELCNDSIQAIAKVAPSEVTKSTKLVVANNNLLEGKYITDTIKSLKLEYKYEEIVVIARTNKYLKTTIEPAMISANIPYNIVGGTSSKKLLDKPVSQYMLSCISYALNPNNIYALYEILTMTTGIGKSNLDTILIELRYGKVRTKVERVKYISDYIKSALQTAMVTDDPYSFIDRLFALYNDETLSAYLSDFKTQEITQVSLCNYISLQRERKVYSTLDILNSMLTEINIFSENPERDKVTLATVHSQKGCEAPVVFACGFNRPNTTKMIDDKEEANILYVQLSRAIERLYIVDSRFYTKKDGETVDVSKNIYFSALVDKLRAN